jgi:regulatory subunit for Cdc7p protein kinase
MVDVNLKTINPLLLDRSSEREAAQLELRPAGAKFTFEAPSGRRVPSTLQDVDLRRQQPRNNDVLHRARALGIKIWAVEKLERMMTTMFETESSFQVSHGHNTRSNATQNAVQSVSQSTREADLLQLLRNERIHGPSDRDPTVASKEMVIFKGPFIYIHDIDEKQKPIMVREYAKVQNKEDGDWPQFRSVSNGRCPFVEEVEYDPCERLQRAKTKESKQRDREPAVAATKDTAKESVPAQAEKPTVDERALQTIRDGENLGAAPVGAKSQGEMMPPPMDAVEHSSKGVRSVFLAHGVAQAGRLVRGEPVASGVQPSNITSAIRSQAISSTAAAPGAKAGTSREVHGLQRKVLEKNSGSASQGQASSHRMTDLYNVVKEDPANRPVTRKSKLDIVDEEAAQVAARENAQAKTARASVKPVEKPAEKKAPAKATGKMGYCENCMETFPDFNEVETQSTINDFLDNG